MKIKKVLSLLFTLLPISKVRIFFLNMLPGFKINYNSYVGFANILAVKKLEVSNSRIKSFNIIDGNTIIMKNSSIGLLNKIRYVNIFNLDNARMYNRNSYIGSCDEAVSEIEKNNFRMESDSLITHRHYFDLTYGVLIGKNVVFGGEQTQCWTHGYDYNRKLIGGTVRFGDDIYVGSRSLIVPDVTICNKVTIAAGTIIHKNIIESGVYASNNLVLKKKYE